MYPYVKSVIRLAIRVIMVMKTVTPIITGKSSLVVASTKSLPIPGQLKTVSVIGAPASIPPKYKPT